MNITTIKHTSKTKEITDISWLETNESGTLDDHEIQSEESPTEDFKEAMQDLKPYFLEILELPKDYGKTVVITEVSIKYKGQVRIFTIAGEKGLMTANKPVKLKTPPKPDEVAEGDDSIALSPEALEALERLEEEAIKYCRGERFRQTELFEGEKEAA